MRYVYWLFLLILAAPAVMFALSNQETVIVQIWPLPFEIPIVTYLLVFIPFLIGFLVGGIVAWFGGGAGRKRAREARHRADEAERKLRQMEQDLTAARSEGSKAGSQNLPARIESGEDGTADKDRAAA